MRARSWKTTTLGFVAALAGLLALPDSPLAPEHRKWAQVASLSMIAAGFTAAKDHPPPQ